MVAVADDILAALNDPALWVIGPERAVFDEHTETRPDGTVETFDQPRLERIAYNCNARDQVGQPCPATLGHTQDGIPETEQPPIVGYWRYFRVAWDDRLGKWVILARPYIRRDRAQEAAEFPRVSVERWPQADFFDPIALLRRTPRLDVGQWTYAGAGKVSRYSMEASMPDFAPPPAAGGPPSAPPAPTTPAAPPAGDQYAAMCPHIKRYMAENFPHLGAMHKMYADEMHPPEAPHTPAEPPRPPEAKKPEDEAARMQRNSQAIQYQQLQQQIAALQYQASAAVSERIVAQLEFEGYRIPDRAKEVERMARLDEAGRKEREQEIRSCYHRAPVGHANGPDLVRTHPSNTVAGPNGAKRLDKAGMERARQYQRANNVSWEKAVEHELGVGA